MQRIKYLITSIILLAILITIVVLKLNNNIPAQADAPAQDKIPAHSKDNPYYTGSTDAYNLVQHDGKYFHASNDEGEHVVFTQDDLVDKEHIPSLAEVYLISLDENGENPKVFPTHIELELFD